MLYYNPLRSTSNTKRNQTASSDFVMYACSPKRMIYADIDVIKMVSIETSQRGNYHRNPKYDY